MNACDYEKEDKKFRCRLVLKPLSVFKDKPFEQVIRNTVKKEIKKLLEFQTRSEIVQNIMKLTNEALETRKGMPNYAAWVARLTKFEQALENYNPLRLQLWKYYSNINDTDERLVVLMDESFPELAKLNHTMNSTINSNNTATTPSPEKTPIKDKPVANIQRESSSTPPTAATPHPEILEHRVNTAKTSNVINTPQQLLPKLHGHHQPAPVNTNFIRTTPPLPTLPPILSPPMQHYSSFQFPQVRDKCNSTGTTLPPLISFLHSMDFSDVGSADNVRGHTRYTHIK